MLLILILKFNKLVYVWLHFFNLKVAGKYILVCKDYFLLFRLIYALYSFTHNFYASYKGLLSTRAVA